MSVNSKMTDKNGSSSSSMKVKFSASRCRWPASMNSIDKQLHLISMANDDFNACCTLAIRLCNNSFGTSFSRSGSSQRNVIT